MFETAWKAGIAVTSNLNLWASHYRESKTVIVVTGTKGKSTTATLIHLMLTHSGVDAGLAGNVGVPPLDIRDRFDTVVFELSSYQTADMDFVPDLIGLTNLYPEHVDWHGSVERYYRDKLNLIARGGKFRVALSPQAHALQIVKDSLHHDTGRIMVLEPLIADALERQVAKSRLKGPHNLENARLAARLALAAGATLDGVLAGIEAFKPLPHRLEELKVGSLTFVDDSISTTPEATKMALATYKDRKIALIAGGHERDQDYAGLVEQLEGGGVALLACLPVTGARLAAAAREMAPSITVIECPDLETTMHALKERQSAFDTVILSPGAPSYNQFKNFEARGDAFKAFARQLFSNS